MPLALNRSWNASACPTPMRLNAAMPNEHAPTSMIELTGVR